MYSDLDESLNTQPLMQPIFVQSYPSGAFLVAINEIPDVLRILVHVKCSDELIADLKCEVRNFNPTHDIIYINPVSTLFVAIKIDFPMSTIRKRVLV